ncbi:MAG: hypothetical protein WEA77_15575 [Hyphomonas sp.]|uniref:hypothetical protein n=1 Tax=Hyphomonas sp. TaxID=87 RepID=UPI0034A0950B
MTLRAAACIADLDCPNKEEYDGRNFSCTHFLVREGARPTCTCRVCWFADCARIGRPAIIPASLGTPALRVLKAQRQ